MNKLGFTLIELAIVVMIIGIIAVIAIPNFGRMLAYSKEAAVKANCHTVQLAAEDFAVQNGGVYASDVDNDATPTGVTIVAMLPNGARLKNPFTNGATEPVNGAGANPGETGYLPIVQSGSNVGHDQRHREDARDDRPCPHERPVAPGPDRYEICKRAPGAMNHDGNHQVFCHGR